MRKATPVTTVLKTFLPGSMSNDLEDDNLQLQTHFCCTSLEDTNCWFEYNCEEPVSWTDGSLKPTAPQHMGHGSQLPSILYLLHQSRWIFNNYRIDLSYQRSLLREETSYRIWERGKGTPWNWAPVREQHRRWLPASPREKAKAPWDVLLRDSWNLVLGSGVLRAVRSSGERLWPEFHTHKHCALSLRSVRMRPL